MVFQCIKCHNMGDYTQKTILEKGNPDIFTVSNNLSLVREANTAKSTKMFVRNTCEAPTWVLKLHEVSMRYFPKLKNS